MQPRKRASRVVTVALALLACWGPFWPSSSAFSFFRPGRSSVAVARQATSVTDSEGNVYSRLETDAKPSEMAGEQGAVEDPYAELKGMRFVGKIKSFAALSGFGFIDCPELQSRFQSDVFLHKTQLEEAGLQTKDQGMMVSFSIDVRHGKPQARALKPTVEKAAPPQDTFIGRIKSFANLKGYGFIACDQTYFIFKTDVFLHRNQATAETLRIGDMVSFTVEVNAQGRPQARNVKKWLPDMNATSAASATVEPQA